VADPRPVPRATHGDRAVDAGHRARGLAGLCDPPDQRSGTGRFLAGHEKRAGRTRRRARAARQRRRRAAGADQRNRARRKRSDRRPGDRNPRPPRPRPGRREADRPRRLQCRRVDARPAAAPGGRNGRRRHFRRRRVCLAGPAVAPEPESRRRRHGDTRRRALDHAHPRRPSRRATRRPLAGRRHRPRPGAFRPGRCGRRRQAAADAGNAARRLAGFLGRPPAARAAATRGGRQPGADLERLARLPRQPQRAGAGRAADRRLPGLRHPAHVGRAALDPVRPARRARPFAAHAPAAGADRGPGDRRARCGAGPRPRLRAGADFYPPAGRRPRRRVLLRRHAGHRPAAGAGAGLLRPGLRGQPRRRALSRLAEPRAAAGTGAEDRLRAAGAARFRARRTMGSAA
jgi:hypothetical protein